MQVATDSVIVRRRVRQDLGDIDTLMESMRRFGQLHPIVINKAGELMAGYRRLEAARRLGWRTINAVVVDRSDESEKLEIELEENLQRHPLSHDEISEGLSRLERLRTPGFWRRLWDFLLRLFRSVFGRRRSGPSQTRRRSGPG